MKRISGLDTKSILGYQVDAINQYLGGVLTTLQNGAKMSADNYYLVRKHPLGGFTYVMGFASDVDENDDEIIPVAEESDPQFKTKEEAMRASSHQYAEYGHSYHPETCDNHQVESIYCDGCGDSDLHCKSCDFFVSHL